MAKSADKPKNIEDFWKIYQKDKKKQKSQIKQQKTKLNELESDIEGMKKSKWIPIFIAIAMVVLTAINVSLYWTEIQSEKITNVIGVEYVSRFLWGETYYLTFINGGENEYDFEVEVEFLLNTTVYKAHNILVDEHVIEENITDDGHRYYIHLKMIPEGGIVTLRLDLKNDDFKKDDNVIILPYKREAWTDKGTIEITAPAPPYK